MCQDAGQPRDWYQSLANGNVSLLKFTRGNERKLDQMLADRSKMTAAYVGWSLGALGFYYAWFQRAIPSFMVDRLMADFAVGGAVLGT